jgi:hypothetical protein
LPRARNAVSSQSAVKHMRSIPNRLHGPLKCEASAGKSAGRESPVLKSQTIEFVEDFGTKIFRKNSAGERRGRNICG